MSWDGIKNESNRHRRSVRQLVCCWGSKPPAPRWAVTIISEVSPQCLGIHYLPKPSGSNCPSASGLHSTHIPGCPVPACVLIWCLWKGANYSIQVTHEVGRFTTEWKVHPGKSLLLRLLKHPEGTWEYTDSSETSTVQDLQSSKVVFHTWPPQMSKMFKPRWFQNFPRLGVTPKSVSPNVAWGSSIEIPKLQSSWISARGAQQFSTLPSDYYIQ